jgi:uncharacterized protein YbjT (DUF2867 family)
MILVTGGSGYLGSHIVRKLVGAGKQVRVMVYNSQHAQTEGRLRDLNVDWIEGDVTRPETLPPALEDVEAVVHTVAIAIEKGGRTYEAINYEGTVHMVDAALKTGVGRFINISQLGAAPDLPYRFLASKGQAQEYVAQSSLNWTAFRPSVIWGPEDEFANTFARLVPITPIIFPIIGDEESKFQPVWVEDVAASVLASLESDWTFQKEYELGGPEILTLEEIERRTLNAVGARRTLVRFPTWLLKGIVTLMEKVFPTPPVTRSLLELLEVENVSKDNAIMRFVSDPKPFTAENARVYMETFKVSDTIAQFMGRI